MPDDPAYKYIESAIIPTVVQNVRRKGKQYEGTFRELGPKGQFADIYRKIGPLKLALWDEKQLPGEQPVELLYDLIGHCLLTIYMLQHGDPPTSTMRLARNLRPDFTGRCGHTILHAAEFVSVRNDSLGEIWEYCSPKCAEDCEDEGAGTCAFGS